MIIHFGDHKPSERRLLTLPAEKIRPSDIISINQEYFYVKKVENPVVSFNASNRRILLWIVKTEDNKIERVRPISKSYEVWRANR